MLDPWIIEEIRRREEERRRDERLPARIEVPVHGPAPDQVKPPENEAPRGVVVIDFGVG